MALDAMSAIGPKQTSQVAPHISAFEGKADVTLCGKSAFAVTIGGKADMGCCTANVCFGPKVDIAGLSELT
jgi:hypothetical protein